ncbi:Avr1b-1 Avirulence-like protein [Phytophthora palmivora]|uniref:RxLR effector protein n=1 Tax=Phytophthora palmivora TaxID=4796 RepID=A0A2P4Y7F9_9STRA|nr:Avr1b-1 Avirulence-like protein [Phytophthora palmivora]
MRLSSALLLAIATTFLASGNAVTASGRSTDLSAMASPELISMGQTIGGEKRSLRYHDNDDRDDKEGQENVDGEERKGTNIYATEKLDEMLASVKRAKNGDDGGMEKVINRFVKWKEAKYNPYSPPTVVDQDKYLKLRQAYVNWAYNRPI